MHFGSYMPAPGGLTACVNGARCDSQGAMLVLCVGGSNGSSSDSAGRQRLQWFACCVCEACRTCDPLCETCDPCDPCQACQPCDRHGLSSDPCTSCVPNAFPRWRRLPPLPPTNPHSHPACYGAVATVIPGTGFAIVGGAVPSQSGRPQHVRHVSVFDWHMGAWFDMQQPCMLPRLDPVVAGTAMACHVTVLSPAATHDTRSWGSPYFAINPGGFNRHATTPAPPAHTAHGPGNQVTGPGSGRSNGLNSGTLSEAGVVEADWESAEMWRVVEESDAIHAIWTRTHVAQVIVAAHVTGANTVAGVTVSDVPAEPAAEADDSTSAYSSAACQAPRLDTPQQPPGAHSSRATYSVLCSLDPNHSLLVFNNLRRRWVPAGPPLPPRSPLRPPLPRPSPQRLCPCGRGSHERYCSTLPGTPTAPSNSHSATPDPCLPASASGAAAAAAAAAAAIPGSAASFASAANFGRLQQLLGCGGRLVALFQPHDPRLPGPSLSAPTQPPITVGSPAAQAQASGSVPVAAARESMQLMYGDSIEGPSGWAMGAPVALPGNGRLHHVLSMHPAV
ncbi:unnamed protein product [Closterium sp. Naga37s-1]|nr:unnamed protein product [Closterium sp. Naga37s-1]